MNPQISSNKTSCKAEQKKEFWQAPTLTQIDLSNETEGGSAVVPEANLGLFS